MLQQLQKNEHDHCQRLETSITVYSLRYSPLKLIQTFKSSIAAKSTLLPDWFSGHIPIHNNTNNIFRALRRVHNNWLSVHSGRTDQLSSRRVEQDCFRLDSNNLFETNIKKLIPNRNARSFFTLNIVVFGRWKLKN